VPEGNGHDAMGLNPAWMMMNLTLMLKMVDALAKTSSLSHRMIL